MILKGFFIILLHWVAGNVISALAADFIPGSIIGMLLLLCSLLLGLVKDDDVRPVAGFLTDNMTIFFLPAFMGIMDLWGILKLDLLAWIAVIILSTVMVLISTGIVQQLLERRKNL
ncbi:MAG: CidA/LrgA family protein [Bacteroidales bacterium]|nr:CidA/LrgA family protein [Bacteroidales bacterium]